MARNWIEYNLTHAGFQFLQEAYQRDGWYSKKPRFKRAKAFRDLERRRKARRMAVKHEFQLLDLSEDRLCPTLKRYEVPSIVFIDVVIPEECVASL